MSQDCFLRAQMLQFDSKKFALLAAACGLFSIGLARAATIVTFDFPKSRGTNSTTVASSGEIYGTYYGADFVNHGFLRKTDGTVTHFDAPGAVGMYTQGVDEEGNLTGFYSDGDLNHGFLRSTDGTIVTFDACGGNAMAYAVDSKAGVAGYCFE